MGLLGISGEHYGVASQVVVTACCILSLLAWGPRSWFRALNLSGISGELSGAGILVFESGLLFHVRLLWVVHLGSSVHVFRAGNLSGISGEL